MGGDTIRPQSSEAPLLTEEAALDTIRDFFRDKPFIVFGTGMSCALDVRFGMPALAEALSQSVPPGLLESEQERQRLVFVESLSNGQDLESALSGVTDVALVQSIVCATAEFLAPIDRECALSIVQDKVAWPATMLIKRLVDTLPEGDPILHVLTPNYDTLFEHACDVAGTRYTTGFCGGIQRQINWRAAGQSLMMPQQILRQGRLRAGAKPVKHARLYKVHGSLNLFSYRDAIIENNAWMWDAPAFARRVMAMPGLSKYRMLQEHRQELLAAADTAVSRANRFLFLGYGFNDTHIESYIKQKLIDQECKGLIVTRDSNPRIEELLSKARNLWLVCKIGDGAMDGTRVFNGQYADWLLLPTRRLWDVEKFTTEILRG